MILVADRGLLSLDNLAALQAVRLASGQALEFILAVLGRRYAEFAEVLATFTQIQCQATTTEVIGGLPWQDLRLAVAHDPLRATQQTQRRNEQIQGLTTQGEQWTGKTRASPTGAASSRTAAPPARFFLALREARLSRIIKVDLQEQLSSYQIDEPARAQAELLDGKPLLVTIPRI